MKKVMIRSTSSILVGLAALLLLSVLALAQITTGTVTGRVIDSSGAVIPGAQVTAVSQTQGTRTHPLPTNQSGDYVIPNLAPDTYTIEVTADSFKTSRREGIVVTGGDRVGVPPITLEVGGTTQTVDVTAQGALVQTQSGERSDAIESTQINDLPIVHGNFASLVATTPGVTNGFSSSNGQNLATAPGASNSGTRLGGLAQNNLMMDGVSAMDTGSNGQMLAMNIESIGEVKVLTQDYQAEYGRSSGLQVTSYTKSGTNELHGSGYGLFTRSNWNDDSWANVSNHVPLPRTHQDIYGYSVGGPVVIPKVFNGKNKLFFFYAHEFRPTTGVINSGNVIQMRMPTALERQGNFSQSLDNNGNPIPTLYNASAGAPYPGNIIPATQLSAAGLEALNQYPLPNVTQGPGMNYNYQINAPTYNYLLQQPAVKVDYQATSKLRISGKYSGQIQSVVTVPGTIQGFSDAYVPYPSIYNYGFTITYVISPTTFIEGTYGTIENQLAGGNNGGLDTDPSSSRLTSLPDFPELYPDAGVVNPKYYAYKVLEAQGSKVPSFSNGALNLPPLFGWGSLIQGSSAACAAPAPACQEFPGWLNINHTQDVNINLTHIQGRHTIKGGFYLNHSYKAQNTGAGGIADLSFQGYVDFENNTNNPLDTGFGFANAAAGNFYQYLQASKFIEGDYVYNNDEFYIQDNWKVTNRLTLDYGIRFVHQQPQYDEFEQSSNFFPNEWQDSAAQVLYVAGCSNGQTVCSGNNRNAMNPLTGQIITVAGSNSQALIGTPVPGVGNPLEGIKQAGQGIASTNYTWPALVVEPRFGFAYDLTGHSDWVVRGGIGLFYDRPDGNTVFSTPGNPPSAEEQNLYYGNLGTVGQGGGLSPQPVPEMVTFQYNAKIPSEWQWNVGVERSLPGQMVVDVSYVGNHGYNLLGNTEGGDQQNLNSVDYGTAYLPKYQDPTLGTSSIPGATAYTSNLLRPFQGLGPIDQNTTAFYDWYHSLQLSVKRRFANGLSFQASYTRQLSFYGNWGLEEQIQHGANGAISFMPDWGAYQALNSNLASAQPNYFIANAVWQIPGVSGKGGFVHQLTNDWSVSSVVTVASGLSFTPTYSYNQNGANVNITGSPDWAGMDVIKNPNTLGTGCSGNNYSEFNATDITGPTYGSMGMESGRYPMHYCPIEQVDMSVTRQIRVFKNERYKLELRGDVWNVFNTAQINSMAINAQFNNPTSMTLVNNQYNGTTLNAARLTAATAGFGAATGALPMRNIQLEIRFQF